MQSRDAVALQEPAAQAAAAGPVVDGQDAAVLHLVAADDPLVGTAGGRPHRKDAHPIPVELGPIAVEDGLLQRVEADQALPLADLSLRRPSRFALSRRRTGDVRRPDGIRVDRLQPHTDLAPVMIEDEH